MKTKIFLLSGILGIALVGFVFTGCKKDSTSDTDVTAAQDEANATNVTNDSKNVSDAAAQGSTTQAEYGPEQHGGIKAYTTHCTVTFNDTGAGHADTMYVNFGSTPVYCNDGRYREGEVVVYWNQSTGGLFKTYFDSSGVVNMAFRNYAVGNSSTNMIEVNGTRTWTNNGGMVSQSNIDAENWSFSANLTLKYLATGKTATWISNRTNTLVYESTIGAGTWYYKITGTASGVCQSGATYNLTISTPLYHTAFPWWLGGCPWIESGEISITRSSNPSDILTIDFGTLGTCDASATATLNGNTYTVSLL